MPQHFTIANFKFGLDARRSELTSVPGTLLTAENGHINQGAQFEKRKAFVKLGQLPASCFGLQETPTGIVTFGSADIGTVTIPAGLTGLVTYQRLRHYIWELAQAENDLALPAGGFFSNINPDNENPTYEPAMTGIVHSCTFGGKAFAIGTFAQSTSPGGTLFNEIMDAQNPITLCYYNSSTIVSCFQGLLPFSNSVPDNINGIDPTSYDIAWFCYVAKYYLGSDFSETLGPAEGNLANYLSVNLTGPVNEPFTLVLSDTIGNQIASTTTIASSAQTTAVGAGVTFYLTKAGGGSGGSIDTFIAPNVDNGVLTGTINLITGAVAFNTSLYQTTLDLAKAINQGASGYTAQAQFNGSTIAAITVTAPTAFGAVVNASNVTISTTGIFTSIISIVKSGSAGAQNYALAGGVTAKLGTGQVEKINFMDLLSTAGLCQGTYQADLVLNGITTILGRGNLTRKRPTFVFFLKSGAAGSVGPITLLDGTNLLSANVAFFGDLGPTAQRIAANINAKWGGGGVKPATPSSWGANYIQVGGVYGVAIHGPSVNSPSYGGNLNVTVTSTTIKVSATPTSLGLNALQLSIDAGNTDPSFACSLGGKLYLANGTLINFSASFDATRWERQDTGAGFFESLDQNGSPGDTIALCPYQGKMAVFNRRSIAIWQVNADPAQYAQTQNLLNIGALAKLSVQPLGDLDVLFLSDTGIRSLRVRDNTLNAFVNDIGSPVDDFITSSLIANTSTANASACAIVEPGSGRYWLHLNGTIYVLSYYPSLKITAWSTYTPTTITNMGHPGSTDYTYAGLTIGRQYYLKRGVKFLAASQNGNIITQDAAGGFTAVATTLRVTSSLGADLTLTTLYERTPFTPVKFLSYNGQVYVLDSSNNVYVYGGTNNNTYDGTVVTITSPWMDMKTPFMDKNSLKVNVAMAGPWVVSASMDPRADDLEEVVPFSDDPQDDETIDSTFDEGSFAFSRVGTHFQFSAMTNVQEATAAAFSAITLQYNSGRDV